MRIPKLKRKRQKKRQEEFNPQLLELVSGEIETLLTEIEPAAAQDMDLFNANGKLVNLPSGFDMEFYWRGKPVLLFALNPTRAGASVECRRLDTNEVTKCRVFPL